MKDKFTLRCRFEDKEGNKLDPVELGEHLYANPKLYEKIFGRPLKNTNRERRYLKITATQGKFSLYRIFRGVPNGVSSADNKIYLNSDGKATLEQGKAPSEQTPDPNQDQLELTIKPVSPFTYFWNSPNVYNRLAFQVAFNSFLLSLLSIALTLWTLWK